MAVVAARELKVSKLQEVLKPGMLANLRRTEKVELKLQETPRVTHHQWFRHLLVEGVDMESGEDVGEGEEGVAAAHFLEELKLSV